MLVVRLSVDIERALSRCRRCPAMPAGTSGARLTSRREDDSFGREPRRLYHDPRIAKQEQEQSTS